VAFNIFDIIQACATHWLFIFIHGYITEGNLLPRRITAKRLVICLLTGNLVFKVLATHGLPFVTRILFLALSITVFIIATRINSGVLKR